MLKRIKEIDDIVYIAVELSTSDIFPRSLLSRTDSVLTLIRIGISVTANTLYWVEVACHFVATVNEMLKNFSDVLDWPFVNGFSFEQ